MVPPSIAYILAEPSLLFKLAYVLKLYGQISRQFLGLGMRNFHGILFI